MEWVEIETQISQYRVRTYRGKISKDALDKIINGQELHFVTLVQCYWFNDEHDDYDENKKEGTFERLGKRQYSNFTGTIYIKCPTIMNIAILKGGFENEPIIRSV